LVSTGSVENVKQQNSSSQSSPQLLKNKNVKGNIDAINLVKQKESSLITNRKKLEDKVSVSSSEITTKKNISISSPQLIKKKNSEKNTNKNVLVKQNESPTILNKKKLGGKVKKFTSDEEKVCVLLDYIN
jgi:hypothetical protein